MSVARGSACAIATGGTMSAGFAADGSAFVSVAGVSDAPDGAGAGPDAGSVAAVVVAGVVAAPAAGTPSGAAGVEPAAIDVGAGGAA